jgi:uncharacterized protein (DUF58 family)
MLYPDFKELLSYEASARGIGKAIERKYSNSVSGNILSHFKGQGMEFDEVRNYIYGDDVRNIEWRASAKSDETFVKIYKEEKNRSVLIAVDNNDYMYFGTRSNFKNIQAARAASILGFAANHNKDKVGFYIFGNQSNRFSYFKPANSKKSLFSGLKNLTTSYEPDNNLKQNNYSIEGAIFNLKRIGANPNILFVISDFRNIGDQFEKNFYYLGKRPEIVFINIIDDSDFYIPDIGKVVLEYGKRRYMLQSSSKRGQERYKKQFEERQKLLKKIAARLKARIININTRDNVLRELAIQL